MRLATYNVENLSRRAKILDLDTSAVAKPMLDDELVGKATCSPQDKEDITENER
ncbi:MAG TPA: hypothetical protein VFU37_14180 [Pyrinomonadaceae bacterium]|nr:hypothetical protein [Pyrinomonadaceae bacterium]